MTNGEMLVLKSSIKQILIKIETSDLNELSNRVYIEDELNAMNRLIDSNINNPYHFSY